MVHGFATCQLPAGRSLLGRFTKHNLGPFAVLSVPLLGDSRIKSVLLHLE